MNLTQIDLRLPYKHRYGDSFSPKTWCVPELYWSYLRDYPTGNIEKVNIIVSDNSDDEESMSVSGFSEAYLLFDFETYFTSNKLDKKKMQLEAVHTGMMQIAEKEGWDTDPLLDAYSKCLKNNLEYQFDVGKLKSSSNRKYKIGFWCNWDIDVFELYWVLYDKNSNEIKRKKLIEREPFEGVFVYYLKWKWLNNTHVVIQNNYKYGKKESWEINIF